jgi:hypothetical protein
MSGRKESLNGRCASLKRIQRGQQNIIEVIIIGPWCAAVSERTEVVGYVVHSLF